MCTAFIGTSFLASFECDVKYMSSFRGDRFALFSLSSYFKSELLVDSILYILNTSLSSQCIILGYTKYKKPSTR